MDPMRPAARAQFERATTGLGVAVAIGFVLIVSANGQTNDPASVAVTIAGLTTGGAAAIWAATSRRRVLTAGAIALVCVWLLPQRDDIAAAVIIAILFGAAIRPFEDRHFDPTALRVAGGAVTAMAVARLVASQTTVAWVVATLVVVVTSARVARSTEPTEPGAGRSIFMPLLVVVTLLFTAYVGAETPRASWFGGGITHGPTQGNEVALTFDDGPNLRATPAILAILDHYRVKGTFFEVGKAIDAQPQIAQLLYADGQLLGNHSYHHDQWRWLDPRYPELQRTQAAFKRAIGTCPVLYRPPHGERTPFLARVVADHHMHMVLWNASAGDWATDDPNLVAQRILRNARPGAILLLHDGLDGNPAASRDVLVRALPLILDGLRAKHLKPVRLDQLLGTKAYMKC